MKGFAIGSGTACVTKSKRVPPSLQAIGLNEILARGTILISPVEENTLEEIDPFVGAAVKLAANLREMSPLWEDFQKGLLDSSLTPGKIVRGSTPSTNEK